MTKGWQNDLVLRSPALFSTSSHFPTMLSFALLQHCFLSVAFQSTHQILLWRFQGLLSLQARLLPFLVPTILQSISLSPGTFPLSPFLFPLLLHQLVQQYRWLSPFTPPCQLKLCLVFLPHVVTLNVDIPQHFHIFIFYCFFWDVFTPFSVFSKPYFLQRSQWTLFATLLCHLLYSLWANFSHPLTKFCTLSPFFPHNLHRGFSLVLSMWCFT